MEKQEQARTWLQSEFTKRKRKNKLYSLRAFARDLKIPAGRVSEFVSGKRNISLSAAVHIAERLGLPHEEKQKLLNSYKASKKTTVYNEISMDTFHYIADWQHYAILNLVELKSFKNDPKWIASVLDISVPEAKIALDRLLRLQLLVAKGSELSRTKYNLTTTQDISSEALRLSHKQSLEKAIESLDAITLDQRDISSITMSIDVTKIPKAKKMIRDFRRKLAKELESGDRTEVYDLNIQLIPLSQTVRGKNL